MTTPYLCFLYLSYILCIKHIATSASVFCLILTLVGHGTHSTQNRKLYMNIISRPNIHTFIIYLASLLVILTVIWLTWLGNEFQLQEQTDTAFQQLKKAVSHFDSNL